MIDFKSINFGESDADTEALRTPLDFNEVFFDPNNYLEELMRVYRYIVRGRKGDGKTAYGAKIKLLTEKTEDYAFKRSLLNFNNTTFSNIKTYDTVGGNPFISFWKCVLLIEFVNMINEFEPLVQEENYTNYYDIEIGDLKMSWNLGNSIFAIDDSSINEVGCIHTSQGLEFDYVGVIIGLDMRYEEGHVVTDFTQRAKTDQSLKGIKKLYKEDPSYAETVADEIIKNTYRTLMTRGMKGCYVYCVDKKLGEYLKTRL